MHKYYNMYLTPKYIPQFVTSVETYNNLKYSDPVKLLCIKCKTEFETNKKTVHEAMRKNKMICCSVNCGSQTRNTRIETKCKHCGTLILKRKKILDKFKFSFCSRSCNAKYHNLHKTFGCNRSKFEKYIEDRLKNDYPTLDIFFNDRETVGLELDIFIPGLKLAFELNGIFHYEPIFSQNRFDKIQVKDKQKLIECYKQNIELCIIDISSVNYFKESIGLKYYSEYIKPIIDVNLGRLCGGEDPIRTDNGF